jgi:hypothetical protein
VEQAALAVEVPVLLVAACRLTARLILVVVLVGVEIMALPVAAAL